MISPAGIPNFLVESSSIAQSAVGVKGLGQAPKMSWAGLHPWEDYNYKSTVGSVLICALAVAAVTC